MTLVRFDSVSKSFSGQPIFEEISFQIDKGDRIGLVGRNGTGKSTIFRLITEEMEPDTGSIEKTRTLLTACLAQLPQIDPSETVFDRVLHSFDALLRLEAELVRLEDQMAQGDERALDAYTEMQDQFRARGGYDFRNKATRVLHGLGFREEEFGLHVSRLSGGQRTRLMLALTLLVDADLLLLDEPENHLDVAAREWLENFLLDWPRAFVIVSHDRRMLNTVVGRVIEIEHGAVSQFKGNYDAFLAQKELAAARQQVAFDRQKELQAQEEAWINRFRYKATKAKQAQSRIKRLEKMERIEAPKSVSAMAKIRIGGVKVGSGRVLEAANLSMSYRDLRLYTDVSFFVEHGERIGILGPNGSGKTTLLRHLAGNLEGGHGVVTLGNGVKIGVYDQHHDSLHRNNSIIQEVSSASPTWSPERIRTFLGSFLFSREDVFKSISTLSGGELSRVALAKLIISSNNLLMLDEPTNHLDIATREVLEQALNAYEGTLIMVSHDRQLIDRLVNRLLIFESGKVTTFWGNYSAYRDRSLIVEKAAAESRQDQDKVMAIRSRDASGHKQTEKDSRKRRRQLRELEEHIEEMEGLIEHMEQEFTQIDPADYVRIHEMKAGYDGLKSDLAEMYAEWEVIAHELYA